MVVGTVAGHASDETKYEMKSRMVRLQLSSIDTLAKGLS